MSTQDLPAVPESSPLEGPAERGPERATTPAEWVTPPKPGEVITSITTGNTYTMGEKIGEGHFGLVFGCVDVWENNLAAKVMKPLGPYEKVKQATIQELRKLIDLRHPNVTYVYDAFEFRETFYIITERCYCPIKDLIQMDWFHGRVWIRPIARCLLQAIDFLHTNGIAHQDVHAGNIFASFARDEMDKTNPGAMQFKLGDFGVAKLFSEIDESNTRAQWMLPPEVLDRTEFGPIDRRIDIYHCGLIFLSLAHGKEFAFTPDEIKTGLPRRLALQLQPPLNFALEKALRRHVQSRTASAMELWRDLNSPQLELPPPPEPMALEFK